MRLYEKVKWQQCTMCGSEAEYIHISSIMTLDLLNCNCFVDFDRLNYSENLKCLVFILE